MYMHILYMYIYIYMYILMSMPSWLACMRDHGYNFECSSATYSFNSTCNIAGLNISICLSIYLSIYPSVYLSIYLSIHRKLVRNFFIDQLHVCYLKGAKWKCTHQVRNSKQKFLFSNLDLVTRKQKNKSLTIEFITRTVAFYFSTSS